VFGEPANLPVGAADDDRMWPHILEPTVQALPADVFRRLREFSPVSIPIAKREAVAEFVRNAVSAVAPLNHFTVEQATAPLVHLVNWAHVTSGLPLRYASLLSPASIEFFLDKAIADGALAPGTVRNYRAHLARVASALGIAVAASPAPIRRDERARPYSAEELARWRLWARTRPSSMSHARADSLLALAAGAGLRTTELVNVRARDIVLDDSDAWVCVGGDRARVVPVLPLWRNRIARRTLALQPDELLFPQPGEASTVRLEQWRNGQATAPQSQRLRASWLVEHLMDDTAAHHLLEWAGIDRGETLAGYLQFLPHNVDDSRRRELIHARTDRSNRVSRSQMWEVPRIALSEGATSKRGRTAQ
jgi:integrase